MSRLFDSGLSYTFASVFGYELHLQIWLAIGAGIRYDDGSPIIIWVLSKDIILEDEITKGFQTKLMYDKKHPKKH